MPDNEAAPEAPTSAASIVAGDSAPPPPAEAPAQPPEANAPETEAPAPTEEAKWWGGIEDDDIRGFAESKNWASAAEAIRSYKNLEAMRGVPEEELARLPKDGDVEGYQKLMRRLGAPEEASEYGELEGVEGEALEWTQKLMHENNVPKAVAQKLLAAQAERLSSARQAHEEAFIAKSQQEMDGLRGEWGAAYDRNMAAAKRAGARLGLTEKSAAALETTLGTRGFMNMMAEYGNATQEAGFVETDSIHTGQSLGATPEAARAKVASLANDPEWRARMDSNDPAVRQGAVEERRKWLKLAQ